MGVMSQPPSSIFEEEAVLYRKKRDAAGGVEAFAIQEGVDKPNGHDKLEPFQTIRASSFEGLPVPEVEFLDQRKLFPMGHASLLTGATKVGKTFTALQLAVACVTKTEWFNQPVKPGPVVIYSAEENINVLHMRLAAICAADGLSLSDLHDLHIINLSEEVNAALIRGDNRTETVAETDLYKRLDLTMRAVKPVVTMADNRGLVVTGSEISRSMQAAAARAFQLLAAKHNSAFIMLQHPSKTGEAEDTGSSGSTAIFAGYRSVVHMKKPKEGEKGVKVLENNLTNYTEGGTLVTLRWDFGRYICIDQPKRAGDDIGRPGKAKRVFKALLGWHNTNHIRVSASRHVPNFGPKLFAASKESEGLTFKEFEAAMIELLNDKEIANEPYGPKSDKTHELILK
jgi:hypothetical protein